MLFKKSHSGGAGRLMALSSAASARCRNSLHARTLLGWGQALAAAWISPPAGQGYQNPTASTTGISLPSPPQTLERSPISSQPTQDYIPPTQLNSGPSLERSQGAEEQARRSPAWSGSAWRLHTPMNASSPLTSSLAHPPLAPCASAPPRTPCTASAWPQSPHLPGAG